MRKQNSLGVQLDDKHCIGVLIDDLERYDNCLLRQTSAGVVNDTKLCVSNIKFIQPFDYVMETVKVFCKVNIHFEQEVPQLTFVLICQHVELLMARHNALDVAYSERLINIYLCWSLTLCHLDP